MRLVSWNIAHPGEGTGSAKGCWEALDADPSLDVALLQEATPPPGHYTGEVVVPTGGPWRTGGGTHRHWRTAVVRCSDRVTVTPIPTTTLEEGARAVPVSLAGSLAGAKVSAPGIEPITVVSAYAAWETPVDGNWIMADTSAHRLISDISALTATKRAHRIIVAGDWNILYGYGEHGDAYWAARYQTVFDRMASLGLVFVGPQHENGHRADPWPKELPTDSLNVPTFKPAGQPATRQLDYVFASTGIAHEVVATALNHPTDPYQWGPSDHARVLIDHSPT